MVVFPAILLTLLGLATLVLARFSMSDLLCGGLCVVGLVVVGASVGWQELQPGARSAPQVSSTQSTPDVAAAGQSNANRPVLIEDRLSLSAIWLGLGLGLLLALTANDGEIPSAGRRFGLLLLSLAGVCLAAVANDLFLAVIAIELATLPATLLLFSERDTPNAHAAAVRSLALNLLALVTLIVAAVLVRATFGTTNFEELGAALSQAEATRHTRAVAVASSTAGEICCVLLLSGLGVHLLAAPFQLAAGEIFEGAKFWGVGLTALLPRGAALLLMIRLLVQGPPRLHGTAQTLLTAVGFLTILVGALLAVGQVRIRRMLAFFIVFQSGLILLSLAGACCERARPIAAPWLTLDVMGGAGAACFCFAVDAVALIGFLALIGSRQSSGESLDEFQQVTEAIRDHKATAVAVCVLLLSLAGVPPFAGFWPRVAILRSILSISFPAEHGFLPHQNVNYVLVAMVAAAGLILLTTVSLTFVKRILLDDVETSHVEVLPDRAATASTRQRRAVAIGLLSALVVVVLGIFPSAAARSIARGTADEQVVSQNSNRHLSPSGKQSGRRHRAAEDDDEM
jgi:NADH:ubiquinone oxidoreductase subunit 2 (subunit N)